MLTSHFASTIAKKDAEERAVIEIAHAIKGQLSAYFSRLEEAQAQK
jgi:hypothetical protein